MLKQRCLKAIAMMQGWTGRAGRVSGGGETAPLIRLSLVAIVLLASSGLALVVAEAVPASTIYRSVGADGVVRYSDTPSAGARALAPPPLSSAPALDVAAPSRPTAPSVPGPDSDADVFQPHDVLAIASPADGSVLPTGAGGRLKVLAAISPPPATGDRLGLEVDGVLATSVAGIGPLWLTNLERGEHRLGLVVLAPSGEVRQRSADIVIHVQRASRLLPANPLRPAPP